MPSAAFSVNLCNDAEGTPAGVQFTAAALPNGGLAYQLKVTNHDQGGLVAAASGTSREAAVALLSGLEASVTGADPRADAPATFKLSSKGLSLRLQVRDSVSTVSVDVGSPDEAAAIVHGVSAALAWVQARSAGASASDQ